MSHSPTGTPRRRRWLPAAGVVALLLSACAARAGDPAVELRPGDHICIVGNTLADRMQHDGWLETYFHSRFPKHDLIFRNLGYAADEVTTRLRSRDFGTPDQWLAGEAPIPQPNKLNPDAPVARNRFHLTNTKADVIFAFFGYNESFAGEQGLPKFRQDLDAWVKHTLGQKYNGQSAPRLVLFSPTATEDLDSPNLPDGSANNKRLALYTDAMAEVAKANGVPFVDLFHASRKLYEQSDRPLTINGVHLNEHGNEAVAKAIDKALFPQGPEPRRDTEYLEKLRAAVKDKNFYWFHRYRVTDGYSTYGDRAFLKFIGGQTNYEVGQRELEMLDVKTANRDKAVWAAARGQAAKVDDSNVPEEIPVTSNKPGPLPDGRHPFLSGQEAIDKMTLAKGLKVTLFADEKEFPDLVNPVQMAFDTKGRLWVAVWPTYPHWRPRGEMNDKLLIFEDTDNDGKADKMKVFADDLHNPTGFEFWNGGVLLSSAPDVLFLKDTDGDDKYDVKVRVLSGIDSADTHHTANSFTLDPGGALYFQEGTFHHTQVETPWGPPVRSANAGVFRYEPRAQKLDLYVNFGFANPHGHVFDRWGQDVVVDGTGAVPYHGTLFSGQTADYQQRHGRPPTVYKQRTRPCPGIEILTSRHFPDEMQGDLLVPNVIGFLGILRYKVADKGASFAGTEAEPLLSSSDPNFRPSDLEMGPDGALYFIDWHNPIIGHMQHNLRDPNRDKLHGRVYKVMHADRPLLKPAAIDGAPVEQLLDLLKEHEDRTRYRARIELSGRDTREVIAAVEKWVNRLDKSDANYEHQLAEALWVHQHHNVVNEPLLKRLLRSPDFRARAAATRVLCYWRDRVREPLKLLQTQINDSHPRVRLEAIRALSFFHDQQALAVAVELLTHPDDEYLRYTFNETLNTLERRLGNKVDRGNIAATLVRMLGQGNLPAGRQATLIETICRHGSGKDLNPVWQQARHAEGYPPALRAQALEGLAEAALTRRVRPKVDPADVRQLLEEVARQPELLAPAIRLAGAWKVKEAAGLLQHFARSPKDGLESRAAAMDALAALGDAQVLQSLATGDHPTAVRFHAATALASLDVNAAAKAGAAALAHATEKDDPAGLIEAFLVRKGGPAALAEALTRQKISADNAKRVLRAMYMAGKNEPVLADAASRLAGLEASPKPPTPQEVAEIAKLVMTQGDAARGEQVFRRLDLGCVKCHAINKAGGNIGPDLGPIGGTSPVEYIVMSVLDPSQAIKEEYLTKVIVTSSGQVYQGVVVQRDKNQVILKDATGKLLRIPAADVEDEANGKSLMPEGVTQILTKNEMLDLIRFVSELGKPGTPYAIPRAATIQRWHRLKDVPPSLLAGLPNRDEVRDSLLNTSPTAWETVYSQVSGHLPLAEVVKPGQPRVVYLQGEVQVVQGGPVEVQVESTAPAAFWVDEEPFEGRERAVVTLAPGPHRVTVRVALGDGADPRLRVELTRPADSRASFTPVHGGE